MGGSLRIGRLAGIDVYMHWTFPLLLVFIAGTALLRGESAAAALQGVAYVGAIFGCVVLHELGHALTARRFGIATRDITLLPIGGVARLERIPENPWQELWVALAGPAVNVAIAATLLGVLYVMGNVSRAIEVSLMGGMFLAQLMWVNIALVVFNMLPAFPMDGGRVLRALLAMKMPYTKATQVAAKAGQVMAVIFGIIGILYSPLLIFIALFVYFGAAQEAMAAQFRSLLKGVAVHQAMVPQPNTLSPYDRIDDVADMIALDYQKEFPVLHEGRIVGLLVADDLFGGLERGDLPGHTVADIMRRDPPTIDATAKLEDALALLQQHALPALPVTYYGQLVGLLTMNSLSRFAQLKAYHDQREPASSWDSPTAWSSGTGVRR